MKKNKKAMSLIKLVAIMFVIICIGTALVVLVADGLDISGNREEKFKAMLDTYNQSLDTYIGKMYMQSTGGFSSSSLNADINTLEYNGVVQSGNIFDILPTLRGSKYQKKVKVRNGRIDVTAFSGKELVWAKEQLEDAITEEEEEVVNKRTDLGEGTSVIEEAILNKIPYVPYDFEHLKGTTIDDGYVIYDKYGNEYVWVPVSNYSYFENENQSNYSLNEFNAMRNSVLIHGGFYIGRYEASIVNNRVSSQRNMKPITNVGWGVSFSAPGAEGAYGLARTVSSSCKYAEFESTLVYNCMWDATVAFMGKTNDRNSLQYGNYNGAAFDIDNLDAKASRDNGKTYNTVSSKTVNSKMLFTTGAVNRNSVKNIYDMAGNLAEWVISPYNKSKAYVRGSNYNEFSNSVSIRTTVEKELTTKSSEIGFRVALYL